jgi:hypothetical protein
LSQRPSDRREGRDEPLTDRRVAFADNFISVRRLPFQTLADSCVPDWIEAIKEVEAMDVDILPPGHGALGTRADATDHRRYVEDLHHAVLEAARPDSRSRRCRRASRATGIGTGISTKGGCR